LCSVRCATTTGTRGRCHTTNPVLGCTRSTARTDRCYPQLVSDQAHHFQEAEIQASRSSTSDNTHPSTYSYGAAGGVDSACSVARGRRPLPRRPVHLRGVLARRVHHGRRRPQRLRRFWPAGGVAGPRPEFWRWLQLHPQVPLRRVQRRDEARRRQLRRHCHLLLRTYAAMHHSAQLLTCTFYYYINPAVVTPSILCVHACTWCS